MVCSRRPTPDTQFDPFISSIPSCLLSPDGESLHVFDCIQYFNEHQVPMQMPDQLPFRRQRLRVVFRHDLPQLFQQLLIVTVRTRQAVRNNVDPLSDAEICRYRARSLADLKSRLDLAFFEPDGWTLGFIIMFMLAEVLSQGQSTWEWHLEAARKIIMFRGGFSTCFQSVFSPRPLLITYAMVDMFTATMCAAFCLELMQVEFQLAYIGTTPDEEEVLSQGFACPCIILQAIIHTTHLRAYSRDIRKEGYEPSLQPVTCEGILQLLEGFEPLAWTRKVVLYGQTQPQRAEDCVSLECELAWRALAACFKAAALLYLLLSGEGHGWGSIAQQVISAKQELLDNIHRVLAIRSLDPEGAVETQLWRFIGWPILISVYVRIGWSIGEESTETEVERLYEHAKILGRHSLLDSSSIIKKMLVKKAENPNRTWHWDDGLDSRVLYF